MIRSVIFDFGGVVADEGFRDGLKAIAAKNRIDPDKFFSLGQELMYGTGYVTGKEDEHAYWEEIRRASGLTETDASFRSEIISRFRVRPVMLEEAIGLHAKGFRMSILSDQTNWLDEIDSVTHFSKYFDQVFNSFYLGKSKREPSLFDDVARLIKIRPEEIVFVDDNADNTRRAAARGWDTIHFRDYEQYKREIAKRELFE